MVLKRSIHLAFALAVASIGALQAQPQGTFTPTITLSPSQPTSGDHVLVHVAVASDLPVAFGSVARSGNTFTVLFGTFATSPLPSPSAYTADFDLGILPAGSYQVDIATTSVSFDVVFPSALLLDGRFSVSLLRGATVQGQAVTGGVAAPAVKLTDESGYFFFFDSGNVELTVKILDGSAVNGHFWLFAASMTDQPFVLQVTDNQATCAVTPCPPKLYVAADGRNQNFIDVNAFTTSGAQQP